MPHYKDYGWNNNELTIAHSYILPALFKLMKHVEQPILDVGCGNGVLANMLISKGYKVYGIDASVSGIEQANKTNSGYFFVHNIEAVELPEEIKNIPFKTVISTEVIEHLYDPKGYILFCKKYYNNTMADI